MQCPQALHGAKAIHNIIVITPFNIFNTAPEKDGFIIRQIYDSLQLFYVCMDWWTDGFCARACHKQFTRKHRITK